MKAIPNMGMFKKRPFAWGVMSSAAQIEGSSATAGRGDSIWDEFCLSPGRIQDGGDGQQGADHFRRSREDIALLSELGVSSYRFSISWPRVQPDSAGFINERGLDFYDALIDDLLEAGIEPYPTLYHWDLPQALQAAGGWSSRSIVNRFVDYTGAVVARLGDRVKHWTTINEPFFVADHGYRTGRHAPGVMSERQALAAAHHLLLAHGSAVPIIRAHAPATDVGIALNIRPVVPANSSAAAREAAERVDALENRWFVEPLARGAYPDSTQSGVNWDGAEIRHRDLEIISTPIDFLGVTDCVRQAVDENGDTTPEAGSALSDVLCDLDAAYDFPSLVVMSSGVATANDRGQRRATDDTLRVRHIEESFLEIMRASEAGVPVDGFFLRSFLDGFEWEAGHSIAYGLVGLEPETLARVPKDSFHRYKELIASSRPVVRN